MVVLFVTDSGSCGIVCVCVFVCVPASHPLTKLSKEVVFFFYGDCFSTARIFILRNPLDQNRLLLFVVFIWVFRNDSLIFFPEISCEREGGGER